MDGMIIDRHVHHSHGHYNGHATSTHLPMSYVNGQRVSYEDTRKHSDLVSSSTNRSDGSMGSAGGGYSWNPYQPRQRVSGREEQSVQSGFYQNPDSRPSLPSLRTVLGENTRSPPTTPHHQAASLQPLPREPAYDQSTYKPPSLYPSKRTRTDSGWDGQDADRKSPLPYMTNRQDDRGMAQQLELPTLSGGSPASYRHSHDGLSQRASPENRGRSAHVPRSPPRAQPPTFDHRSRNNPHLAASQQHLSKRDAHMDANSLSAYESSALSHSRSSSISFAEDEARRASTFGRLGPSQPFLNDSHRQSSLMPSTHNTGYRDEYPSTTRLDVAHGYNGASYPYTQAFFVPSHYDYQNGKSRKRSNLPKQSTEIMKRWFDDNLQNPYPSEEQKRHFAAVAGINLTQVSNWFINHRRRCPELREKRDKGRAGSRDESV